MTKFLYFAAFCAGLFVLDIVQGIPFAPRRLFQDPISRAETCQDDNRYCPYWSGKGYCNDTRFEIYMAKRCKESCGFCPAKEMECGSPIVPLNYVADARIVNGSDAVYGSIPWQVSLRVDGVSHWCGGSLISNQYVLSAAHCFDGRFGPRLSVLLGNHQLSEDDVGQLLVEIDSYTIHPDYNRFNFDNDYALVKLAEPVEYTDFIRPICLPNQGEETPEGTTALTSGWGSTAGTGSNNILQKVDVPIISPEDCAESYETYDFEITTNMTCAGYPLGQKDACQGDSGGPLIIERDGRHVLIGVVSWGVGCALPDTPGVYSKVSQKVDWINSFMEED
ncbi:anionic trypsin-2-like [Clavelina lepadiformis]|uniref:Uncharacterized protein n=1 Tax=Clavelina lepadiformis TaxID=159417 RepID=A0ABP0FZD5_CLALP